MKKEELLDIVAGWVIAGLTLFLILMPLWAALLTRNLN